MTLSTRVPSTLLGAADEAVMQAAVDGARVLISADTDFGELLALNRHPGPSVVILRRSPHARRSKFSSCLRRYPVWRKA